MVVGAPKNQNQHSCHAVHTDWPSATDCSTPCRSRTRFSLKVLLIGALVLMGRLDASQAESQLINLSTRAFVGAGQQVMAATFVIPGTTPKTVAVTGWGPRLADYGVSNVLADPFLSLYTQNRTLLATCDNWDTSPYKNALIADNLAPKYSNEPGIVMTLNPGVYTGVLSGVNAGTGNGQIAVWDVETSHSMMTYLSTQGWVDIGGGLMISGFVVNGSASKRLLIRGLGPSLANSGLLNALADPTLSVYSGSNRLATNDNWADGAAADELTTRGLQPSNAHESAIILTLGPGSYTNLLSGVSGAKGLGLVEVYDLDSGLPIPPPFEIPPPASFVAAWKLY
jgi:hypothetical protein